MKILCVQLLRLGDVLMVEPALAGLRADFPDAEIHLLTNLSNELAEEFLGIVDRFHYLDRDLIQNGLGQPDKPMWYSYDLLLEFSEKLSQQKFDKIINFTQNKFSAHLCSSIEAGQKSGMHYSKHGLLEFNCFWSSQLNSVDDDNEAGAIHFCDHFQLQSGSARMRNFAKIHEHRPVRGKVVVQSLSSDKKKDMSTSFVREVLEQWSRNESFTEVVFLCAPHEQSRLQSLLEEMPSLSLQMRVLPCSLTEALSEISTAEVFLTVDTSIKHLACFAETPIVEVALGSSHTCRTGVYQEGAVIVSSQLDCYPCSHKFDCFQSKRYCQLQICGKIVADLCYRQGSGLDISSFFDEVPGSMRIERVQFDGLGLWSKLPLTPNAALSYFDGILYRAQLQMKAISTGGTVGIGLGSLVFQVLHSFESCSDGIRQDFIQYLSDKIAELKQKEARAHKKKKLVFTASTCENKQEHGNLIHISSERRNQFILDSELRWLEKDLKFTQNLYQQLMERK